MRLPLDHLFGHLRALFLINMDLNTKCYELHVANTTHYVSQGQCNMDEAFPMLSQKLTAVLYTE